MREQGISLQLKGTLTKIFREQWNLLIGNKEEKLKLSRDQGNLLPSLGGPHIMNLFHQSFDSKLVFSAF